MFDDITEETETAQALIASTERLRLAIEAGKMAVWEVCLDTGAMTPSPELNSLLGFDVDAKPSLTDIRALYAPGELERLAKEGATVEAVRRRAVGGAFEPWRREANGSGQDRTQVQAEVAIVTPAGIRKQLLLRAQYVPTPDGRPQLTGLLIDVTEKKQAEERLALVASELHHRVKNSLSIVQAMARLSLRNKAEAGEAIESLLGRIAALASASDLILESRTVAADLRSIIDKIVEPYRSPDGDPFIVAGDAVELSPKAATAMGMVLHELCTNAVKYGALSNKEGRTEIVWDTSGQSLVLTWREFDGPPVLRPARRGFGSKLIANLVAGADLGGRVEFDFKPEGLHCTIELPRQ